MEQQTADNPPKLQPPLMRHTIASINKNERQALCGGTTYVRCTSSSLSTRVSPSGGSSILQTGHAQVSKYVVAR